VIPDLIPGAANKSKGIRKGLGERQWAMHYRRRYFHKGFVSSVGKNMLPWLRIKNDALIVIKSAFSSGNRLVLKHAKDADRNTLLIIAGKDTVLLAAPLYERRLPTNGKWSTLLVKFENPPANQKNVRSVFVLNVGENIVPGRIDWHFVPLV
jgi:hypothetical protein